MTMPGSTDNPTTIPEQQASERREWLESLIRLTALATHRSPAKQPSGAGADEG